MNAQAYDQYKKTSIESISPGKLLLMLFEGAIRNVDNAKQGIIDKDINTAHTQIVKTQNIILELISSLDMEYEISNQLFDLYEFIYYQLVVANAQKDLKILDDIRGLLVNLYDMWDETVKKAGVVRGKAEGDQCQGLNIKG